MPEIQYLYFRARQRLPVGNCALCTAAQQQENIAKNRFKTTFPCKCIRTFVSFFLEMIFEMNTSFKKCLNVILFSCIKA